jgi:hypothetical protein
MKSAYIAAGIVAAASLASTVPVRAAGGHPSDDAFGGRLLMATMLVPKIAPQSPPPAAPQRQPAAPPHPSVAPPQARPMPRAPFGPGGLPHHGGFPHYRSYIAPPIVVPQYLPPPAYYGYGTLPYSPPPSYYDYAPPVYAPPPPVYVERDDAYWYYCSPLGAYYPDVTECPDPWIPVPQR